MPAPTNGSIAGPNRASRRAGLRLSLMLSLLLVPILALLYFYANGAMQDIRLGERQAVGTSYLQKISSVYVDVVAGKMPEPSKINGIRDVPSALAARRPSLSNAVEALTEQSSLAKGIGPEHLWHLRNLTLDVASAADLALGEQRDQQLLALAVSTHLPELANQVKMTGMGQLNGATQTEFSVLRSLAFQALSEAVKEDASGNVAKVLNQGLADFDAAAEMLDDVLLLQETSKIPAATNAVIDKINQLSVHSIALLATQTESRTRSLKRQLAMVIAAIALASLFALGFATHMVKATFGELDTVETAKMALETSEAQAVAHAEDLQKLNGEIANLNVELTQNFKLLQETQDDNISKSKMAQLGALTAMVAHELRNPLGAVRTSSFTIDKISRRAGLDLSKQTGRIAHAVERCDATISQLLDYAASKEIEIDEVDLGEWLIKLLQEEAQKLPPWIELELLEGSSGVRMSIDQRKLGHAIAGVLANSVQAYTTMRKDGDLRQMRIEIRSGASGQRTEISITDFGPGIPEDKLSMVKEPLFTTKSFGPGLGLAIADQVTKLHGGNLAITSDPGKWTRVTISLPRLDNSRRVA